jgi:hypothetical protein
MLLLLPHMRACAARGKGISLCVCRLSSVVSTKIARSQHLGVSANLTDWPHQREQKYWLILIWQIYS